MAIFGIDAVPTRGSITRNVNEKWKVGIPPAPRGRPKTVADVVTGKVVEYCTMLRAW